MADERSEQPSVVGRVFEAEEGQSDAAGNGGRADGEALAVPKKELIQRGFTKTAESIR